VVIVLVVVIESATGQRGGHGLMHAEFNGKKDGQEKSAY
jgi:hypothetical protein